MSVLMEFAIFPTDKGESVSEYVSKVIKMIDESGIKYQLTPMGTIIETQTLQEALEVIEKSYKAVEPYANRVYVTVKFDIRKNRANAMASKIESIKNRLQN